MIQWLTLKLEIKLKIPNTPQTCTGSIPQPEAALPLNSDRGSLPPAYNHLLNLLITFNLVFYIPVHFFCPCVFTPVLFQISHPLFPHVAVRLSSFNVLYTDDDSCIAVETPVRYFLTGETKNLLLAET